MKRKNVFSKLHEDLDRLFHVHEESESETFTIEVPYFKESDIYQMVEKYPPEVLKPFIPYLEETDCLCKISDEGYDFYVLAEEYISLVNDTIKQAIHSWQGFSLKEYNLDWNRGLISDVIITEAIINELNKYLEYDKIEAPLSFDSDEDEFDTAITEVVQNLLGDNGEGLNDKAKQIATEIVINKYLDVPVLVEELAEHGIVFDPIPDTAEELAKYKEEIRKGDNGEIRFSLDPSDNPDQLRLKLESKKVKPSNKRRINEISDRTAFKTNLKRHQNLDAKRNQAIADKGSYSLDDVKDELKKSSKSDDLYANRQRRVGMSAEDGVRNLTNIGRDKLSAYKQSVAKNAKETMDRAVELGLAEPHDFGKGKGKYISKEEPNNLVDKLSDDEKALEIGRKYANRINKKAGLPIRKEKSDK